ncbi:hypothetical protein [Azospirillum sp. SYSU D00513]|uniref:hypothetical protein n=1 Tax=Azospirillum sp. SYSU D00513 TaxID=2812561 RepID=UPI001A96D3BE|nr:hypothetical protein [Azospirillum sp. SYSU D00513]
MADRLPATINIGGALPTSLRSSLAEVIAFQGCRDEFGNGYLTAEEAATLIEEALRDQKVLMLRDEDASNGMFEELESFLRQNGICYKRTNDAWCEIDCAVAHFDGNSLVEHLADKSGNVAVTAKRLEQAQAEGTLEALIAELRRIEAGVPPLSDGPNPWQVQALVAELEAVGRPGHVRQGGVNKEVVRSVVGSGHLC